MFKSESHVLGKHHHFQAEEAGTYLAGWLNGDLGQRNSDGSRRRIGATRSYQQERGRVMKLLESIQHISAKAKAKEAEDDEASYATLVNNCTFTEPVNRLLKRYRVHPVLTYIERADAKTTSGQLDFGWTAGARPNFNTVEEWQAIEALIEIGGQGLLANLKTCENCALWMFAHFSHQRFCRDSCREAHFKSSELFKAKRRAYMRRYYGLQRHKNVK